VETRLLEKVERETFVNLLTEYSSVTTREPQRTLLKGSVYEQGGIPLYGLSKSPSATSALFSAFKRRYYSGHPQLSDKGLGAYYV